MSEHETQGNGRADDGAPGLSRRRLLTAGGQVAAGGAAGGVVGYLTGRLGRSSPTDVSAYTAVQLDAGEDALPAAVEACAGEGGGTVLVTGELGWRGELRIPAGVNLQGVGGGTKPSGEAPFRSGLIAADSSATLVFEGRGGITSNLVIDGAGVGGDSGHLVRYDTIVERAFMSVTVINSAAGGELHSGSQNSVFINHHNRRHAGDGLTFDSGAGALDYLRYESSRNGGHHLLCLETRGEGPYPQPRHIVFTGAMIERSPDGDTSAGGVTITAGSLTLRDAVVAGIDVDGDSLIRVAGPTSSLSLDGQVRLQANSRRGISQEDGATVISAGLLTVNGFDTAWWYESGSGRAGYIRYLDVGSEWGGPGNHQELTDLRVGAWRLWDDGTNLRAKRGTPRNTDDGTIIV